MKVLSFTILLIAILTEVACGTKSNQTTSSNAYVSNGVCYLNGVAVANSQCPVGSNVSTLSQACNGTYWYCPAGCQTSGQGCQAGSCTTNPDNCGGHAMYVPSTCQQVTCQ